MTTEFNRDFHEMVAHCNVCSDESMFYGTWNECIAELKEEGWKIYKDDNDEWCHKCPLCMEKENRPFEEIQ